MQLYGFCYTGPAGHFWQKFVEHFLGSKKDTATLLKKVRDDATPARACDPCHYNLGCRIFCVPLDKCESALAVGLKRLVGLFERSESSLLVSITRLVGVQVLLDSVSFGPLANILAMAFFSRLIEGDPHRPAR